MKKIIFIIVLNCFTILNYGQMSVNIGNDTTFCASNIEDGIELASHLVVTGGTAPYTYCWEIDCFYPIPNFNYLGCASDYLNDTTLSNPTFTQSMYRENTQGDFYQDWFTFILTVEDLGGNIVKDSINIRFSRMAEILLIETIQYVNEGDSTLLDIYDGYGCGGASQLYGGILPYTSFSWTPIDGLSNPTSAQTWCKPLNEGEWANYYSCRILDSIGCSYYTGLYVEIVPLSIIINETNAIYQEGKSIFLPKGNKELVNISFYDLSGKLIYKDQIYTDNYTPNFEAKSGQVFICQIELNKKIYNLKYIIQ